jgi:hypothetical protein
LFLKVCHPKNHSIFSGSFSICFLYFSVSESHL